MPSWHPHPDVWLVMAASVGVYLLAMRSLLARTADGPQLDPALRDKLRVRQVFFLMGVAVLWVGADYPVHELAEDYLFSIHMVQHTLFSLVAPPLLLLGLPAPLIRRALRTDRALQVMRFLTRPLVALVLFNGVVLVTHWPALVDASLGSEPIHFLVHFVLFSSAVLMWWPVIDPLPELKRLSEPGKMLYLFLQSILPTVPASFITFAQTPVYTFYADAPRIWGMDVITDQQVAGLIMKIGGGLLLWLCIATIYFKWNAKEERGATDEISWEDFERELHVWDLRRR